MKLDPVKKTRKRVLRRTRDGEVLDTLNQFERAFVEAFVHSGDLVQSYRDSMKPGRTQKPIDLVRARHLIALPHIRAALDEELQHFSRKFHVDQDVALQYVASIALSDAADLVDEKTNTLKPIHKIPLHIRRTIQSLQQMQDGSLKVTLASKDKAASLLMQATGHTGAKANSPTGITRVRLAYDKTSGKLAVEFKSRGPALVEVPEAEAEEADE